MTGVFVQTNVLGGTRSRLFVADGKVSPGARTYRDLQSLLLRRGVGRPRSSKASRARASAPGADRQVDMERAFRGHQYFRASSEPQWDCDPEVLSQYLEIRAEKAILETPRRSRSLLEILGPR